MLSVRRETKVGFVGDQGPMMAPATASEVRWASGRGCMGWKDESSSQASCADGWEGEEREERLKRETERSEEADDGDGGRAREEEEG